MAAHYRTSEELTEAYKKRFGDTSPMKTEKIHMLVDVEISFNGEQDRLNAIEYAHRLIMDNGGTGVKFVRVESAYIVGDPKPESSL